MREVLAASIAAEQADPTIRMEVATVEDVAELDQPLTFLATLSELGSPIPGVEVEAVVRTPAGACLTLRLVEDGSGADETASDGVYTTQYVAPRLAGTYALFVTVEGTTGQGEPFTRARLLRFFARVSPSSQPPPDDGTPREVLIDFPRPRLLFSPWIPRLVPNR